MTATPGILEVLPLGGCGEIGLNMLLLRAGQSILAVDCGLMFPEAEHLGVDLLIPDFSYLLARRSELRAIVLTHGHEDHVGALPYLLREIDVPVYGTPLTLALVRAKLREFGLEEKARLHPIKAGDILPLGPFTVEPVAVSHSIADGVGLGIDTPAGLVVHSGDFKLDADPVDGRPTDLEHFRRLGDRGVLALFSDSTNAEVAGTTPSERSLLPVFRDLVGGAQGRAIVATFSSHLHRIQQVVDVAEESGKRVHLSGRSMVSTAAIASELGYLRLPGSLLVEPFELPRLEAGKTVILTTGSQGEPLSALSRMAVDDHRQIKIRGGDRVLISARVIPGHEKSVARVIDNLFRRGAEVHYPGVAKIHVSGHASRGELRTLIEAVRPRHLVPVHGERRHLHHHARLAAEAGLARDCILLASDGDLLAFSGGAGRIAGHELSGRILVDGKGRGGADDAVLRDRRRLSREGFILVAVGVAKATGEVVAGPEIVARGLVYADEASPLIEEARAVVLSVLSRQVAWGDVEVSEVQEKVRRALKKLVDKRVQRRPLILPTIFEV